MARKSAAQIAHESDAQIIADHLREVAEQEGFCDLFYQEIKRLNSKLAIPLKVAPAEGRLVLTLTFSHANLAAEHWDHGNYGPELTNDFIKKFADALAAQIPDLPVCKMLDGFAGIRVEDVEFDPD